MDKNTNSFTGQPILGQFLGGIPQDIFKSYVFIHQFEDDNRMPLI
jgi:hypothetical protein